MTFSVPSNWWEVLAWFLVAVACQLAFGWYLKWAQKAADSEESKTDEVQARGCLVRLLLVPVQFLFLFAFALAFWGFWQLMRV